MIENEFAGVRLKPRSAEEFAGVRLKSQLQPLPKQQEGDSWPALIGKSALKGVSSLADIPKLIGEGVEGYANFAGKGFGQQLGKPHFGDIYENYGTDYAAKIPTSDNARAYLKSKTGIDLEPKPTTGGQRIASHLTDFTSSLSPWGLLSKANKAKEAYKLTKTGAAIGGTSGTLQEMGVDPLVADIGTTIVYPASSSAVKKTVSSSKNLLNRFSKEAVAKRRNMAASKILKKHIGEEHIPTVLDRLNTRYPMGIQAHSAELAQNTGLSGLHRAMAPNIPAIAEKEAFNDAILKNQLNSSSPKINNSAEKSGEQIRSHLSKKLESAKQTRGEITKPLYAEVAAITETVDLPNTRAFLEHEKQYAKGDKKKALNYVEDLLTANNANKKELSQIDRFYSALGPDALQQLRNKSASAPIPIELNNAVKDISGRIGAAKRAGNEELARMLGMAKENILADMAYIPEEATARLAWKELSKPVSAIEKEPMLSKITKKDQFGKEFLLSPEKIPDLILNGSLNNTKALIAQTKGNKKALETVRSGILNKMLASSEVSSVNALGEQNLSYNKFKSFFNKNKAKMELIFDKNQIQVLKNTKDILKNRNMVTTLGRAAGSNTQSELTLLNALTEPAEGLAHKVFKKIPGGKFAYPVYEAIVGLEKKEIKAVLEQALLAPKKAKALLTPTSNIKSTKQLHNIIAEIYNPALAAPVISNMQNRASE